MPVKPRRTKIRKKPMDNDQEQHLIEGFCLGPTFPFENEAERKRLYLENKEYLFDRAVDPERKHDHFFYRERKEPKAYLDYETERGRKKYLSGYRVYDREGGKVIGDSREMWPNR